MTDKPAELEAVAREIVQSFSDDEPFLESNVADVLPILARYRDQVWDAACEEAAKEANGKHGAVWWADVAKYLRALKGKAP